MPGATRGASSTTRMRRPFGVTGGTGTGVATGMSAFRTCSSETGTPSAIGSPMECADAQYSTPRTGLVARGNVDGAFMLRSETQAAKPVR